MLGIIIGILLLICVLIFMKRYVSGNVPHEDVNKRTIEITQHSRALEANYCLMVSKVRFKLGSLYTVSTFTVI